jgi:WD40 repeat protein
MPQYELTHDTIARQVYQKASTEARTRRKVERYIRERYAAFQERGVELTQDDVDYVWPYLDQVNSPDEEIDFLKKGKSKLLRKRRIQRAVWIGITVVIALLAIWALQQRQVAEEQKDIAQLEEQKSRALSAATTAELQLRDGYPAIAYRLAEQAIKWNTNERATKMAMEVIAEIQKNPLVCDVQHKDSISVLQFSLDGTFFLSASLDGEARLSSLDRKILLSIKHKAPVLWASLLYKDQCLAVQTADNSFYLYNLKTGNKQSFAAGGQVNATSVLRNQPLLAAAIGKNIMVWNVAAKEAKVILQQETTDTLSAIQLVAKAKGWELITSDRAGNAYRWDKDGKKQTIYPNVLSQPITGISIDSKAEKIVFRTPEGDFLTTYEGDTLLTTTALVFRAFQPNTSSFAGIKDTIDRLVGLSQDSSLVYIFNFGSKDSDIDMQHSPKTTARCGILSPDGRKVLSGSADNETVVFYIKEKFTDFNQTLFRFNLRTDWGVFAPNNAHFLSSASGNKALLWKFDQEYIENKLAIPKDTLMMYYQTRLQPLTKEERQYYQLD